MCRQFVCLHVFVVSRGITLVNTGSQSAATVAIVLFVICESHKTPIDLGNRSTHHRQRGSRNSSTRPCWELPLRQKVVVHLATEIILSARFSAQRRGFVSGFPLHSPRKAPDGLKFKNTPAETPPTRQGTCFFQAMPSNNKIMMIDVLALSSNSLPSDEESSKTPQPRKSRLRICDDTAELQSLPAPTRTGGPHSTTASVGSGDSTTNSSEDGSVMLSPIRKRSTDSTLHERSPTSVMEHHPPIFHRSESSCFDPVPLFYSKSLSLSLLDSDDDDDDNEEPIGLCFVPDEMETSCNSSDGKKSN